MPAAHIARIHRALCTGLFLAASINIAAQATSGPIAIVPIDAVGDQAATVTGALQVTQGRAMIAASGAITSGTKTTDVILPHRGVLRVCASTTVRLTRDSSVQGSETPVHEVPGLMMAIDHGAVEASFATGVDSDVLLTPDFRILIGGPGSADLKVRLGEHGDTCVENAGVNAPYVLVSSVFDGGAYRVQAGQRVMFQHGSLREVVDQEKEPCGCPPPARPGTNDFPFAESAGLAPLHAPAPAPEPAPSNPPPPASNAAPPIALNEPLVYQGAPQPVAPAATLPPAVPQATPPLPAPPTPRPAEKTKPGLFHRIGGFFRRIFGAD